MAKLDLIDRTVLVEELENLKAILGDVFLGMVVERAIERVEAQPGMLAVEVIRCKDCAYYPDQCLWTRSWGADGFCPQSEPKMEAPDA